MILVPATMELLGNANWDAGVARAVAPRGHAQLLTSERLLGGSLSYRAASTTRSAGSA